MMGQSDRKSRADNKRLKRRVTLRGELSTQEALTVNPRSDQMSAIIMAKNDIMPGIVGPRRKAKTM
jgi:hypothetical protein